MPLLFLSIDELLPQPDLLLVIIPILELGLAHLKVSVREVHAVSDLDPRSVPPQLIQIVLFVKHFSSLV